MRRELLELEEILEQEISACSKLEQYITDKREFLIAGDLEGLAKVDYELEKYNSVIEKLEEKKRQLYPIEENQKNQKLNNLKKKLNELLLSIDKKNNISSELIKHSLNIIEFSISSITKALVPESISYNSKGRFSKAENAGTISSVIHEA